MSVNTLYFNTVEVEHVIACVLMSTETEVVVAVCRSSELVLVSNSRCSVAAELRAVLLLLTDQCCHGLECRSSTDIAAQSMTCSSVVVVELRCEEICLALLQIYCRRDCPVLTGTRSCSHAVAALP